MEFLTVSFVCFNIGTARMNLINRQTNSMEMQCFRFVLKEAKQFLSNMNFLFHISRFNNYSNNNVQVTHFAIVKNKHSDISR